MKKLRQWFGPSRAEMWRQLSEQIDARYVEGSFWKGDRIEAAHGDWKITIDTYTVHAGKVPISFTRLRAPYLNVGGFRFTIYRRNVFTGVAKLLGMQDIEIGDGDFDHAFVVKATSDDQVRQLLSNPGIRAGLEAQPDVKLTVDDDEGWFRPTFPEGVDALSLVVRGALKDVDRLKQLYALLADTLDQLSRIGSAYDAAPDLTLR